MCKILEKIGNFLESTKGFAYFCSFLAFEILVIDWLKGFYKTISKIFQSRPQWHNNWKKHDMKTRVYLFASAFMASIWDLRMMEAHLGQGVSLAKAPVSNSP